MEVKEYDEIYNVVADQNYPDGITKNQKDALRNKAKKSVIRDGLLYYCDKKRGERQVGDVCVCVWGGAYYYSDSHSMHDLQYI